MCPLVRRLDGGSNDVGDDDDDDDDEYEYDGLRRPRLDVIMGGCRTDGFELAASDDGAKARARPVREMHTNAWMASFVGRIF